MYVTSKDGTKIYYKKAGTGPAIVLVDGALCWTEAGVTPGLLPVLSEQFTVYAYDRRGRGKSGDTKPYTVEREYEDLAAMMAVAGDAYVCGFSSGGALALYATAEGFIKPKVLISYEAPFTVVDATDKKLPIDAVAVLDEMIAKNQRKAAVKYFLKDLIGMPGFMVSMMFLVMRKGMKMSQSVAHTLPNDIRIMDQATFGTPIAVARKVTVPTLVLHGAKTAPKLKKASEALAKAIPGAQVVAVPQSSHMVKPAMLTPLLVERLLYSK